MALWGRKILGFLHRGIETRIQDQQVRHQFVDWKMLRDYKKRMGVKEHGEQRLRLNALRKNTILPPELQAIADQEIAAMPRLSRHTHLVPRCVVTSRALSSVKHYRVSRIVFRHLADYNQLSGWERARW